MSLLDKSQLDSDKNRKLLAELLAAKEKKSQESRIGPVSFAQQRLWFLYQLAPDSSGYNVPIALRSERELDVNALKYALKEIVRRHHVLRTVFTTMGGVSMQQIKPPFDVELPVHDLSKEANPEEAVGHVLQKEANLPFNLRTGPLLRAQLLHLGKKDQVLLIVLHHIVFDGWSTSIFFQELDAHYRAYRDQRTVNLPKLPFQYIDYAVWQRNWLKGEILEDQLEYWKHQLTGTPSTILLPLAKPRSGYSGKRRGSFPPIHLPRTLTDSIQELASADGVTLFVALLATFKALLVHYSGQQNIVVGIPVAGRDRSQVENLIGFFVNMLVLHTDFSGNPGFREIVRRVNEVMLGAFRHQDMPFEKLVQELNPDRDSSVMPITQVVFNYQQTSIDQVWLPNMGARLYPFNSGTVRFDIETTMFSTPNGVKGYWGYDRDLFDAGTMARMLNHYQRLLEGFVADPDRGFMEIPILDKDERRQVLVSWNNTSTTTPYKHIHEWITTQVKNNPEGEAVNFEGETLSYQELDMRANQLALRLQGLGVGPEIVVGVYLMPSLELIITLLGILKIGGTYVPLDPVSPLEWLNPVLNDLKAPLIVTLSNLAKRLPEKKQGNMLLLDQERSIFENQKIEAIENTAYPENVACIIYSLDTAEVPTGTMITYGRIHNQLQWLQQQFQLEPCERLLMQTPFNFSASIWEIFWPLVSGASLFLTRYGGQLDSSYLLALVQYEQINVMHFAPTMLWSFLSETGVEECESLRLLLCSGEPLNTELEKKCRKLLPNINLYNLYETNETGQISGWRCEGNGRFGRMSIGHPISNSQIYVLDEQLEPVPVEVTGEIYVGGIQLARGYRQKPKVTAENFIPNPHGSAGSRLYRTGDLGRFRANGTLELVGRRDSQIYVEGVRLEIGLVENILQKYPQLETAIVSDYRETQNTTHLVAYMIPKENQKGENTSQADPPSETLAAGLRSFSQMRLPPPLVPAYYVLLERLPMQANGKLDRSKLPEPSRFGNQRNILPRNEMEQKVADIWQSVLQREEIGIYENFFDLGGHSLLVVQVMARLRDKLGVDQPANFLFRYRTIADLATRLSELIANPPQKQSFSNSLIQLQSGKDEPALVLVHPIGGGISCYMPLTATLPDQAIYALEAQLSYTEMTEMAANYVDELLNQLPDTPFYLGGWSMGGVVAFEMARQLAQKGMPPVPVILIDSFIFPPNEQKKFNRRDRIQAFFVDIIGGELPHFSDVDWNESDEVILAKMLKNLQSRGRLPGVNLEVLLTRFNIYCSNTVAFANYVPQFYAGVLYLIKAQGPESSTEMWQRVSKSLTFYQVEGNHYNLLTNGHVSHVGELIQQILSDY